MNFQVDEIGRVISVRDGIARVYGLNEIQAREMVEFANTVKEIALNLEKENIGIVVFGSDTAIKEGDLVKHTGSIVDVLVRKDMLGHVVDALVVPIDERGALSDHERRRVELKAVGLLNINMCTSLCKLDVLVRKDMLGHVVDALVVPIDGRGALSDHERRPTTALDPAPLQFIAPYSGCVMREYFLDNELFYREIRPAINLGLSVSRVGFAAKLKTMKQVYGSSKLELAQYQEVVALV
nr:ATPase subunit 1, mitochondrial [Tanacetum cinerariifolium]